MSLVFSSEYIDKCRKEIKEIKSLLSLNQQFSKNTVDLYKKEIESLRKEIKYWEKSIVSQ